MKIDTTRAAYAGARLQSLLAQGLTAEQATGFMLAEETTGMLRPGTPAWKQRSATFRIERGEALDLESLDRIERLVTGLWSLDAARADAWAAETA